MRKSGNQEFRFNLGRFRAFHEPPLERGCVGEQPQRVTTFVAAAAGAPLPTHSRAPCANRFMVPMHAKELQYFRFERFSLTPALSRWESGNSSPTIGVAINDTGSWQGGAAAPPYQDNQALTRKYRSGKSCQTRKTAMGCSRPAQMKMGW